jgi:hypothetical protein
VIQSSFGRHARWHANAAVMALLLVELGILRITLYHHKGEACLTVGRRTMNATLCSMVSHQGQIDRDPGLSFTRTCRFSEKRLDVKTDLSGTVEADP